MASKAMSIGAAISISLEMLNGLDFLLDPAHRHAHSSPAELSRPADRSSRLALGALLDAVELVIPERLEGPDPVVDCLEAIGVQFVQPLLARAAHADKAHLPQHPQVLGDLRLGQAERSDHVVHRPLAPRE